MSENKECETVEIKVERDVEQEKEFVDCIKEEQDEWGDEEAGDTGLYAGREVKHEVVVKEEPVQPNIEFVGACRVPEKCFPMKKSMAWEFFTDLDHKEKLAQCNFCKKVISYKDGFNLTCHTKSEHPKEFNRVMESDFEHSLASDSQAKVTKQPASLPLPSSSSDVVITQYSHVPATDVSDMLRQQKPFEDEKTKTINKKLVKLFAKHYLPFSLVESAEFKQFVQELNPGYELPSKNMLSDVLIEKYYNETKYTVKDEIDKTDHVALTVDEWYSSNKNEFYIDVTAHFINEEAELKAYILECAQCDYEERQNAEKLAEKLRKICEEWEISNKIVSVTTDDVHNIKSAVALNQWRHVTCFAYSLNLAFQNALDKSKLIHQKVNRVVKFFKRSSFARKRLKRMQDILGEPDLNLKEDVDGQWHTTCAMFERVIEMRNSLHRLFTEDYPDEIFLTNNDLDVIQGVTEVFRFFKDVTKEMSSGRTVTIAEIVYYASALKYKCAECLLDKTLPGRVGNLVRCLDKDLEKQSSNLIHDSLMLESTLLDPRFKKQGFLEFCTNLAARSYIHTSAMKIEIPESSEPLEDITPPPAKKRIGQTLDSTVSEVMETNLASIVQKEMDRYFEEPPLPKNQNPHKWWLSKKIQYPRLYAVACPRLSIPATAVPPEQIFLKSGRILTESRNRLSGYEAERLVFLNKNL